MYYEMSTYELADAISKTVNIIANKSWRVSYGPMMQTHLAALLEEQRRRAVVVHSAEDTLSKRFISILCETVDALNGFSELPKVRPDLVCALRNLKWERKQRGIFDALNVE